MPASNKQISQYETAVFGGVYFSEEGNIYIRILQQNCVLMCFGYESRISWWLFSSTKHSAFSEKTHETWCVWSGSWSGMVFFATCFQHIPIDKPWCWNMHTNICPDTKSPSHVGFYIPAPWVACGFVVGMSRLRWIYISFSPRQYQTSRSEEHFKNFPITFLEELKFQWWILFRFTGSCFCLLLKAKWFSNIT